jgi:hypothetical protein
MIAIHSANSRHRATLFGALFVLCTIMASCGGSPSGSGGTNQPPTATLSASPSTVLAGVQQGIVLTFTSMNADSGTITGQGPVGINSHITISPPPTATTTYTYTATGPGGTTAATAMVTVNPITSFAGIVQQANSPAQDVDPNGAVGTHQYLEYVNTYFQAFDKSTLQPILPIGGTTAPQLIGNIWTGASNGNCEGTSIQLDAVVTFDRLAAPNGRFVVAGKSTRGTLTQADNYLCIAVSSTDDLTTSTWYSYSFHLNPVLGTEISGNPYYPDWPKLGTWPDGSDSQEGAYYFSMDLEDQQSQQELGIAVCALDRTNLVLGNPMRTPQCFVQPSGGTVYLAHSLIPADFDGTMPPPLGRNEYLLSIQNPPNDGISTMSSFLNLWACTLDATWSTTSLSCTQPTQLPTLMAYTPGCYTAGPTSAITNCVLEPDADGGAQKIDSVGDRLMPRFSYRNFGTYESFLISQTVQTGLGVSQEANQTGIEWYELRPSSTSTAPTIFQQGMISPDNNYYRFLPSIAQDSAGNAAVGYSVSNNFTDPQIDFSFWSLSTTATPTELLLVQGAGQEVTAETPPENGVGKWGSYSSMSIDPSDDCTFWYVNEYWPTDASWATNVSFFKIPGCS